jgi:hypothetical protein
MTGYVAELTAAWLAFAARGRAAHPALRVVFAALAGGAVLQLERLASRDGALAGAVAADRGLFYDTSSYGAVALRAAAAHVGAGQLVLGSDRPVVDPVAPPADLLGALARDAPARLLGKRRP